MSLISNDIKADFSAFADPATLVEFKEREVSWTQSGERRTVRMAPSEHPGFPNVTYHGTKYGYRQFFASVHMADLKAIAETQLRVMKLQPYIDSTVEIDEVQRPSLTALMELMRPKARSRTSIVFLQGEAGAGKTTLLKQLSVKLAADFVAGTNDHLTLYVDAQNRSLARLDEAVALVLQDFRAKFTYHALATLARIGLLIPIIDGFDELLGARGYEDALSSLLRFLERLSGEGMVITSARSSFYRFQNVGWLRSASLSGQLDFEVTVATLQNWTADQIEAAIDLMEVADDIGLADAHDVLIRTRSAVSFDVWQLFTIPFFAFSFYRMIKHIAERTKTSPEDKDLRNLKDALPELLEALAREGLTLIIVGLILREVPKLRGRDEQPLLVPSDHAKFLQEVAEEMWMQEVRVLDRSSVESLLEIIVEGEGKATLFQVLKGRAGVHPLLTSAGDGGFAFRHDLFFSYFMANDLWYYFKAHDSKFYRLFGRSTITTAIADEFVKLRFLRDQASPAQSLPAQSFLDKLAPADVPPSLRLTVRRNAGEVIASVIRQVGPRLVDSSAAEMLFERVNLRNTVLEGTTFIRCELEEVDLRGAAWTRVDLSTCLLSRTLLSAGTKLTGVVFPALESLNGIIFDDEKIFEPTRIVSVLQQLGCRINQPTTSTDQSVEFVELSPAQKRRVALLSKLVRATNRTFRFSIDDLENAGVVQDPDWKVVERLLERHKLLETDLVARRGASGQLRRFAVPTDELEAGVDGRSSNERIAMFWREFLPT